MSSKNKVGRPRKKVYVIPRVRGSQRGKPRHATQSSEVKRLEIAQEQRGKRKRKRSCHGVSFDHNLQACQKKRQLFQTVKSSIVERKRGYKRMVDGIVKVHDVHRSQNAFWNPKWVKLNSLPENGTSGTCTFGSFQNILMRAAAIIYSNIQLDWTFLEVGCSTLDFQKCLRMAFPKIPIVGIEYQNLDRYMFQDRGQLQKAVIELNEISSIASGQTTTTAPFVYRFNCALQGSDKTGQCLHRFLRRECSLCKNDPERKDHTCNGVGLKKNDLSKVIGSKAKFVTSFWESFNKSDKIEYLKSASKFSSGVAAFFFAHRSNIFEDGEVLRHLNKYSQSRSDDFVLMEDPIEVVLAGKKSEKYQGFFYVRRKYCPSEHWPSLPAVHNAPLNPNSSIHTSAMTELFAMNNSCVKTIFDAVRHDFISSTRWKHGGSPSKYHCAWYVSELAEARNKTISDVLGNLVRNYFNVSEADVDLIDKGLARTRGSEAQSCAPAAKKIDLSKFLTEIDANLKDATRVAALRLKSSQFEEPIRCRVCGAAGDPHYMEMHCLHPDCTECSSDALYKTETDEELLNLPSSVQVQAHQTAFEMQNKDIVASVLKEFIPVVEDAINEKKSSEEWQELEYLHRLRAGISKEQIREYLRHEKRFVSVRHVNDNITFQFKGNTVTLRLQQTELSKDPETRASILAKAKLPTIHCKLDECDTALAEFRASIIYALESELSVPLRSVKISRENRTIVVIINVDGGTRVKRSAFPTQTVVSGHIVNFNHRPTPNSLIPLGLSNTNEDSDTSFRMLGELSKAAAKFQDEVRTKGLKVKCWDGSYVEFNDLLLLAASDQKAQQYLLGHSHSFSKSDKAEPYLQAANMKRANAYGTHGRSKGGKHMFYCFDPIVRSNVVETCCKLTPGSRPTKLTPETISEVRNYLKSEIGDYPTGTSTSKTKRSQYVLQMFLLLKNVLR